MDKNRRLVTNTIMVL